MDQSKKTMREFLCRDVLWETFDQMAKDFDCSIGYLVNEAMRYYARSKNYQSPGSPSVTGAPQNAGSTMGSSAGVQGSPSPSRPPMPRQPVTSTLPPPLSRRPAPQTPGDQTPSTGNAAHSNGTTPPEGMPQMGSGSSTLGGSTLFLVYNGQRYPVTKDQFIIGRGSKTSDLPIKDGNISRKHAAVIRRNGTFYIKDLGSTNGIDYKGMRIDNKRIDEGDVFHLCDYELRFTYRAD
jgi:hypothetical protein